MKNELIIKRNGNQYNLIASLSELKLYELSEEQINTSTTFIIENISRKKLRKAVLDAIEDLSGVAAPNSVANPAWIALDNQRRLELIYQLLSNFRFIEKDIRILKTKRNSVDPDFEYRFLSTLQNLCRGVVTYAKLKSTELEDSLYQPNLLDIMNGITTKEQKKELKLKEEEERKLLKK